MNRTVLIGRARLLAAAAGDLHRSGAVRAEALRATRTPRSRRLENQAPARHLDKADVERLLGPAAGPGLSECPGTRAAHVVLRHEQSMSGPVWGDQGRHSPSGARCYFFDGISTQVFSGSHIRAVRRPGRIGRRRDGVKRCDGRRSHGLGSFWLLRSSWRPAANSGSALSKHSIRSCARIDRLQTLKGGVSTEADVLWRCEPSGRGMARLSPNCRRRSSFGLYELRTLKRKTERRIR